MHNAIGACAHSFDGKPTRIIILGRGMQQLLTVGSYLVGVRYVFQTTPGRRPDHVGGSVCVGTTVVTDLV